MTIWLAYINFISLIIVVVWSVYEGVLSTRREFNLNRILRTFCCFFVALSGICLLYNLSDGDISESSIYVRTLFHSSIALLCIRHYWTVFIHPKIYYKKHGKCIERRKCKREELI